MFTAPRVGDLHAEIWRSSHSKSGVIANSITWWFHYRDYLKRVLERYEDANSTYLEVRRRVRQRSPKTPGRHRPSRRVSADMLRLWPLTRDVHLEIESFYVFAKILVGRVADTFALFFLGHLFAGLGSSHRKLKDRLASICQEKNLRPGKLTKMAQDLQKRIVDHRTEVIEHLREPRYSPGSFIDANGKIRIEMGLVSPTDADHEFDTRTTEAPTDLMAALDDYLDAMTTFLRANRDKSVLASRQEDKRCTVDPRGPKGQ
jgi:hypothetical protein